jgi:hypothetical protein
MQNFVNATVNLVYSMARHPSMMTAECSSSIESSLELAELDNYTQYPENKVAYYFTLRFQDENMRHSQVAAIRRSAFEPLYCV